MTDKESKTAEACAKFMGWSRAEKPMGWPKYWWLPTDGDPRNAISVHDYNPAEDSPRGREQANELLEELERVKCIVVTHHAFGKAPATVVIQQRRQGQLCTYRGEGPTWTSALAAAVEEMGAAKAGQ